MPRRFTLSTEARLFQSKGLLLSRIGEVLPRGTTVQIGDAAERYYDHRLQTAYPIEFRGETYFLLADEAEIPPVIQ